MNKKIKNGKNHIEIMKHFRCSVWGEIEVSPLALSIIDTFEMQRLQWIRQTGFAYKVFPTATSSRFEHSLGVYHVTKVIIETLNKTIIEDCDKIDHRTKELITIVALVHDLGHGPFSHLFDTFLSKQKSSSSEIPKLHEQRSCFIFCRMVQKYNLDFRPKEVEWICRRILTPPFDKWYDTLVSNPYSSFDTDKIDYLKRDANHFGLHCSFDFDRILKNIRIIEGRLCFCEKIKMEIDKFFIMREEMHRSIYRHPTVQKFDTQFLELLSRYATFDYDTLDSFLLLHDAKLLDLLPLPQRIEFETRSWKTFHEPFHVVDYYDEQREIAMINLLWYCRKYPQTYFFWKSKYPESILKDDSLKNTAIDL